MGQQRVGRAALDCKNRLGHRVNLRRTHPAPLRQCGKPAPPAQEYNSKQDSSCQYNEGDCDRYAVAHHQPGDSTWGQDHRHLHRNFCALAGQSQAVFGFYT